MSAIVVAAVVSLHVGLVLCLGKSHGRQVRLEREHAGHLQVDYMAENHPFVEALWERDARTYWRAAQLAVPILSVALLGLQLRIGLPALSSLPLLWSVLLAATLGALVYGLCVAFCVAGLASLHQLRSTLGQGGAPRTEPALPPPWESQARTGSVWWWGLSLVVLLAALTSLLVA